MAQNRGQISGSACLAELIYMGGSTMATLYWTADSPFCRVVLWTAATLNLEKELQLKHLTWQELRNISAGETLGNAATVPCLQTDSGILISDSLRIIAYLMKDSFSAWLLSCDGETYRMAEGQLSRVMYALYDGAQNKAHEKIHKHWLRALLCAETSLAKRLANASESNLQVNPAEANLTNPTLSIAVLHTFISFCLSMQPDWRRDIPHELEKIFMEHEKSVEFQSMRSKISAHIHGVPCNFPGSAG
jgi:glutathione S-transferase